jgi:diguanylate cyclase
LAPAQRAVVGAIIDLARILGLLQGDEGIERPEELRVLEQLGGDQGQGFLFAHPLPAEEIPGYLAARPKREDRRIRSLVA